MERGNQRLPLSRQKRPAVFFDRDGVIVELRLERGPRETARTPDELTLLPEAKGSLAVLRRTGVLLVLITNQPNVAKGKTTWELQAAMELRFAELLGGEAKLDATYTCFHHPDSTQVVVPDLCQVCSCRKPAPGLLLRAADDLHLDLGRSVMVGDSGTDMEAGRRAGCATIRLLPPWSPRGEGEPAATRTARDLPDAVPAVLYLLSSP